MQIRKFVSKNVATMPYTDLDARLVGLMRTAKYLNLAREIFFSLLKMLLKMDC
jgi:hypothetical protein